MLLPFVSLLLGVIAMTRRVAANSSTGVSRRSAGSRKWAGESKGAAEAGVAGQLMRVISSDMRWCLPSGVVQTAAGLLDSSACSHTSEYSTTGSPQAWASRPVTNTSSAA